MDYSARLDRVESDVQRLKEQASAAEVQQSNMQDDVTKLTVTLNKNVSELEKINTLIANKRGFIAGIIATVTTIAAAIGLFAAIGIKFIGGLPPDP